MTLHPSVPVRFVAWLALLATAANGYAADPAAKYAQLSEDAATTRDALLQLSQQEFTVPYNDLSKSHAAFLEKLTTLSQQVSGDTWDKLAPNSIDRSLVEMARTHARHPAFYGRLVEHYGRPPKGDELMHVQRPPQLDKEHAIPEYRTTWELLLVAPVTRETNFLRPRAYEALASLRSDASIPVLMALYQRAQEEVKRRPTSSRALREQFDVITTLNQYTNLAALHALLACATISKAQSPPAEFAGRTLKDWVTRLLCDQEHYGNGAEWRMTIEKALADDQEKWSAEDRAFLEMLLRQEP